VAETANGGADLIVVGANPLEDITDVRRLQTGPERGAEWYRTGAM
jgi:hypothetical protein